MMGDVYQQQQQSTNEGGAMMMDTTTSDDNANMQMERASPSPSIIESNNDNNSVIGGGGEESRTYKEMIRMLKDLDKQSDALAERIVALHLQFADLLVQSSILIDPELVRLLHECEELLLSMDYSDLPDQNNNESDFLNAER